MLRSDMHVIDRITSFVYWYLKKKNRWKAGQGNYFNRNGKKHWQNKILSGIMRKATGGVMLCSSFDGVCGFLLNQAKDS